jgi:hypothetical protein
VRVVRTVVFSFVLLLLTRAASAQGSAPSAPGSDIGDVRRLSVVTPGTPVSVPITIVTTERPAGLVEYSFVPASGVEALGERTGTLTWNPDSQRDLRAVVRLAVGVTQPSGRLLAGRLSLRWSDGRIEAIDVWVDVRPLKVTASRSNEFDVELTPVQRSAPPGGAVRFRVSIYAIEPKEDRLRIRILAPPGWTVTDSELEQREWRIEPYGSIEQDIDITIPEDARVGDRPLIRLLVEVAGQPEEIEALSSASVIKSGGAKPGVPLVSGSSTFGYSQLGASGVDPAQRTGALTLSSKFGPTSSFSFSYDHGIEQSLSNYRYEGAQTRLAGSLRYAGWDASFGNYVSAQGNAITGPFVLGRGVSVQRPAGPLLAEIVVSQPNTINAIADGHLFRGRVGMRKPKLTVAFTASDFGRPAGGYTTISNVQTGVLDAETEAEIEFERRLTTSAASNSARGMGVETEFSPSGTQRITARTGELWLSNAVGDHISAPVGEASYGLVTKRATFNARWRDMPPTVSGVYIPGDDLGVDGSVGLWRDVRLVGRGYQSSTHTFNSDVLSDNEGASLGVRVARGARRVEVRANYGESQYSTTTVRRTVSIQAGTPMGPFHLNGSADVGEQDTGVGLSSHLALYRGDVAWVGSIGNASLSVSRSNRGGVIQQRLDLLASLHVGGAEFAGGTWLTRGYGRPGAWTSIGVPVGFESMVVVGLDYSPLNWTDVPSLRGSLAFRKALAFPVPFAKPAPPMPTAAPKIASTTSDSTP